MIKSETLLKVEILTRGVVFTENALVKAAKDGAKGQNLVYNMPLDAQASRPQELFIEGLDGYTTVVSCVAPNGQREPVTIDADGEDQLLALIEGVPFSDVTIRYVKEPGYYSRQLENGDLMKKYISACGYDEMNILPWKGCGISKGCKFCGVNTVANENETDLFTAFTISQNPLVWEQNKQSYLANLQASITFALKDECYEEHVHLIMISGNLSDDSLDFQADIYCEIAENIKDLLKDRAVEGLVAVMTPPKDFGRLAKMKNAGIDVVVFNLEVANEPWFSKYCPGKSGLGQGYFTDRLEAAVEVFGAGKVWTNFVFGLEPVDKLLEVCESLAQKGIVAGANVLHLDKGNRLDCSVPTKEEVIYFFTQLASIYKEHNFDPYYCQKALRTSLSNEAFAGRLD